MMGKHLNLAEIGARISEHRKAEGLTIDSFADRCGISEQTVKEIEKGSRDFRIQTLASIISVLGVSSDYILGRVKKNKRADFMTLISELADDEFDTLEALVKLYIQRNRDAGLADV